MADWYVSKGGKTHGPFSSSQLKQLATTGKITEDTEVRLNADGKWTAAKNVKGLFEPRQLVPATKPAAQHVAARPVAAPPVATAKAAVPVKREPAAATPVKAQPAVAEPVVTSTVVRGDVLPKQSSVVAAHIPCPFCGEEIKETAIKCRHCNEFLDGRPRQQQASPQQVYVGTSPQPAVNVSVVQQVNMPVKRWSPAVAMILSFLLPGLGQMYKGQILNGVAWFAVTAIGYVLFIIPGLFLHFCCILGAGMGDPYR